MKIAFRRIGKAPHSFDIEEGGVKFSGTLESFGRALILVKAHIGGSLEQPCDICNETVERDLDEAVEFLLSDGVYRGEEEAFDVIEILDEVIDMDELLHSEIELIKSDYFSCQTCKTNERS